MRRDLPRIEVVLSMVFVALALPLPAQVTADFSYTLPACFGLPTETVEIPILLDHSMAVEAFGVSIQHDDAVVALISILPGETTTEVLAGDTPAFFQVNLDPLGGPGGICFAVLDLEIPGTQIPPGTDREILRFFYEVSPIAALGSVSPLDFCTCLGDPPVENVVTADQVGYFPDLTGGSITVGEDPDAFLRGDADGSGALALADVLSLLGFLFLGGAVPCVEAVDFNDDGALGLADALDMLSFLFGGGAPPGPPFPACEPASDPALSCETPHPGC